MQVAGYIRIIMACLALGCFLTGGHFANPSAYAQSSISDMQLDTTAIDDGLIHALETAERLVDNHPDQALSQTSSALDETGPETPSFITVRLLAANSMALGRLGSNREALERANQALAHLGPLDEAKSSLAKAMALAAYARARHNLGELAVALDYFYQAWGVYHDLDDSAGMASMGIHRAIIHEEIGQTDRAIDTYKTALIHAEDANSDFLRVRIVNNMGFTYLTHGQPEKALAMLQDVRPLAVRLQNPLVLAYIENNIGEALFHLGRHSESRIYLQKSLDQANALGISSLVSGLYLYLGRVEEAGGHVDKAMTYAQNGLSKALQSNEPARVRDLLALKARLHHAKGDHLDAYTELRKSYSYRDEINSKEVTHLAEVLGAQFSLDSKEQEITLLQRDQEISVLRLQREKALKQGALYGSFLLLVLIAGLALLLRSRTKATRKAEAKSLALLEIKEELQKVSEAKSNILAVTSHEVKTPLNGIMGMAQILLRSNLSPEQRQQLETLYSSADMLLSLLNDILDLSQIEAGHVEIHPAPFDLDEMTNSLYTLWKTRAEDKGLILICERDMSLPDKLIADAGRIRQVLSNLVSNAIKFSDQGEIHLSIQRSIMEGGRELMVFAVKDNGVGISEDKKDLLFMPFVQLHSETVEQSSGTGLGLSICRELVTLMGGEIGCDSLPEGGTKFWFTLPLVHADKKKKKRNGSIVRPQLVRDPSRHISGRILIAEDNEMNKLVLREMLRSEPWELQFADNGVQAVELVASGKFDLVLMDIDMPVMNGTDAVHAIRALGDTVGTLPIIALTAYPLTGAQSRTLYLGMDACLEKPINRQTLLAMIERYMSRTPDEAYATPAKLVRN